LATADAMRKEAPGLPGSLFLRCVGACGEITGAGMGQGISCGGSVVGVAVRL